MMMMMIILITKRSGTKAHFKSYITILMEVEVLFIFSTIIYRKRFWLSYHSSVICREALSKEPAATCCAKALALWRKGRAGCRGSRGCVSVSLFVYLLDYHSSVG